MTKEDVLKSDSFNKFRDEEYKSFKEEAGRYPTWKEEQEFDDILYERFIKEFKITIK